MSFDSSRFEEVRYSNETAAQAKNNLDVIIQILIVFVYIKMFVFG